MVLTYIVYIIIYTLTFVFIYIELLRCMLECLNVNLPPVESQKLRAFMTVRYPLSLGGQNLMAAIHDATRRQSADVLMNIIADLPTVENPKLHLYEDLLASDDALLGPDLSVVSLTDGCTHDCHHCIVSAPDVKVTSMPYPAILKIAERKKHYESQVEDVWLDWSRATQDIRFSLANLKGQELVAKREVLRPHLEELFRHHPVQDLMQSYGPKLPTDAENMRSVYIMYRGDPSDYRDYSFLHENGDPADWGDAFSALATPLRPINFTTAGWSPKDRVATRGAQKIHNVLSNDGRLSTIAGVSVNPFDVFYRRDPVLYKEQIEKILSIFGPTCSRIFFSYEKNDNNFFQDFYAPIVYNFYDQLHPGEVNGPMPIRRVKVLPTSHLTGKGYLEGHEDDWDPMNVSAGNHILPNGSVARREHDEKVKMFLWNQGQKGARPIRTGNFLWKDAACQ